MKNNKGFTLIEILAVIIILGVLMIIAVPNVVSVIEKNKKNTMIADAKTMISLAQYKIKSDTSINLPMDNQTVLIMTLGFLNTDQIVESPYGEKYSLSKSFIAVTLEKNSSGEQSRNYYAHLVACEDDNCTSTTSTKNSGINLTKYQDLKANDVLSRIKKGGEAYVDLINDESSIKRYFEDNYEIKNIKTINFKI